MARPNKPSDQSAKEQAPVKAPDAELEEEGPEKSDLEQEHERDQRRYGNAAMSAIMGVSVAGAAGTGGGGGASLAERELEAEIAGEVGYGGDDDDVVDGPLTLEDLTRSWNPKARAGKDAPAAKPRTVWEDLPAQDEAFLAEIRRRPAPKPQQGLGDGLYQPTVVAVSTGLSPWAREIRRWTQPTVSHRTLLQLMSPPTSLLQDPHGRQVFSRARAAAIANCMALDEGHRTPATAAFIQFCMELAGSDTIVQHVWDAAVAGGTQLPMARNLVGAALPPASHRLSPRSLSVPAHDRLTEAIVRRAGLGATRGFVPDALQVVTEVDLDDTLGIDEVLSAFTGASEAADRATYDTVLRSAERMASACAHTRIRYAGVSVAIGGISSHWSAGTPAVDLLEINQQLDADIQSVLKLLVDVARAAKGRTVDPAGLRNGLKRAARMIERSRLAAAKRLATLIGAVLLPNPDIGPEQPWPENDLQAGWDDGLFEVARRELLLAPPGLDRDVALTLTGAVLTNAPAQAVVSFTDLSTDLRPKRPLLAAALDVFLCSSAIWAEAPAAALQAADRLIGLGRLRRNGVLYAAGALTHLSALELDNRSGDIQTRRLDFGAELYQMGAPAALSLLARWTPPEED